MKGGGGGLKLLRIRLVATTANLPRRCQTNPVQKNPPVLHKPRPVAWAHRSLASTWHVTLITPRARSPKFKPTTQKHRGQGTHPFS